MKQALYGIAIATLAAMPASAETSFPFTCTGEGDVLIYLGLFAEGGGIRQNHDGSVTDVLWYEQNGVTVVVEEADPTVFVVSFVSETGEAMVPYEAGALMPVTCRLGAE
jgi:hypothetical protein